MKAKKVIAMLMAATMVLSLSACGGADTTATTGTETEEATADDTADEANEADEADGEDAEADEAEDLSDIIPEETVTLDVYDQLANYSGEQIGWFGQVMLEKFNVKLNIIPESDGTFETRMESGNLGDIVIWGDDSDFYHQAIEKGMLYDWNEDDLLADYGSYIEENMKFALEKNTQISGDGNTYGYGFDVAFDSQARQEMMYEWDLRWDLYKELGYPEIKNFDDVVSVL